MSSCKVPLIANVHVSSCKVPVIANVHVFHVKYLLSKLYMCLHVKNLLSQLYICLLLNYLLFLWNFNEISVFSTELRKIFRSQLGWESLPWEQCCSTKIDRTDTAKLMVVFRNFANAIKNFAAEDEFMRERATI